MKIEQIPPGLIPIEGDLALRLGYKTKNLQIGRHQCLAITALKVEQFYNKIRLGDTGVKITPKMTKTVPSFCQISRLNTLN